MARLWPLGVLGAIAALFWAYLATTHQSLGGFLRSFLLPGSQGQPAPPHRIVLTHAMLTGVLGTAGKVALHILPFALAAGVLYLAIRWTPLLLFRAARMREMLSLEIVLGPDDTAEPFEVMSLFDTIANILRTRYAGGAVGQSWWCFEVIKPGDTAEGGIHFVVTVPKAYAAGIQGAWHSKYTNIRFVPWEGDPPRVTDGRGRWRPARNWPWCTQGALARTWTLPLKSQRDYQNMLMETLVAQLESTPGPCRLQYVLQPVSIAQQAHLKQFVIASEQRGRLRQVQDPAHQGVGYVEDKELKSALEGVGKAFWRVELRWAAESWDMVQAVLGALGESASENQITASTVVMGKRLWLRWLEARAPSLFLFQPLLLSSLHLATLIQLPTARLRVQGLERSMVRRGVAVVGVNRDEHAALVRDERGPAGLHDEDWKYNVLCVGTQGAGKSTVLQRVFAVQAANPNVAVVVVDANHDLAESCLALCPSDREVVHFAPGDPGNAVGYNPLLSPATDDALVGQIIDAFGQVWGQELIGPKSQEYLRQALYAVVEGSRRGGERPAMAGVYRILADGEFRRTLAGRLPKESRPRDYWLRQFAETEKADPAFTAQTLSPPLNKLDALLSSATLRAVLGELPSLDLREVVSQRQILLADVSKSRLSEPYAFLLGTFLIGGLWHAIQAQEELPFEQRVPLALVIDEAHNFVSPQLMSILAEGRKYGARTALGFQFLRQIRDETVREAIRNLCQSRFLFQTRNQDDATDFAREMMRTWANMIQNSAEAQDQLNFGPDDLLRMPRYHCVCFWIVHGQARPAFLGQTIPPDTTPEATEAAKRRAALRWAAATASADTSPAAQAEDPDPSGEPAETTELGEGDSPGAIGDTEDDAEPGNDPREEVEEMPEGAPRRPKPIRAPWAQQTGLSADEALSILIQEGGTMDDFNRAMARLRDQANRKDGVKRPAGLFRYLVRQMIDAREKNEPEERASK